MSDKLPSDEIKFFGGNTIRLQIDRLAGEAQNERLKYELKAAICKALGWSRVKLGRVLNQTDQPTTPQLVTISQLLGVTTDSLIKLVE